MTAASVHTGGESSSASPAEGSTQNKVAGNMQESVQAGVVNTINYHAVHDKLDLFARQVNETELDDIRKWFLAPENFESAARLLTAGKVVVLLGPGSVRTSAGLRLLDDQTCARLVHLSPERSMRSVKREELRSGDGYLWDLSEQGARPFKRWEFDRVRQFVEETGDCRLVVVLNDGGQVPPEVAGLCVELKPPDAVTLAEAAIDRAWSGTGEAEIPRRIFGEGFTGLLTPDASPERALFAADLAVRVARGELTIDSAMCGFEEGFGREVAGFMNESWRSVEHTLMFTVALLQDEPIDEVVDEAYNLNDLVRRKQLKEGKKLRPRRAFVKPNDELLRVIGARTEMRDNPSHLGLTVETVQFVHRGWAEAVLCRIWQHYHVDHDLLLKWMCGQRMSTRHFKASVWALCTLITQVAAGDRLRELHRLAGWRGFQNWALAAVTLARLDDRPGFQNLA
jgi:hypothetical protein